jgi:hypothetical protein
MYVAARMNVGLSMLVPFLLSTLATILNKIALYVVPAEHELGAGRPTGVTVSALSGSIGVRLARVNPVQRSVGGHVWRQARSALPATRSSFRSRFSG